MLFDLHSHILPEIDDGAKDMEESIQILKLMKEQGITDVIATPHFYPAEDNLDEFINATSSAYKDLKKQMVEKAFPNIYLGCELLYFSGISTSDAVYKFCLNNTKFLLIEFTDDCINESMFKDVLNLRDGLGIEPIIAHVERYCGAKKYKKFIKFLVAHKIPVQINADSVITPLFRRIIKKLLKAPLFCVIASDAHSVVQRPPKIKEALEHITKLYGEDYTSRLLSNSEKLYKIITAV